MPRALAFRALAVWGVIILLECVNGVLRRLLLEPIVGVDTGHRLGVLIGSAVVLIVSVLSVGVVRARGSGQLLAVGALWASLTLVFEVGLGLILGAPLTALAADYDLAHGGLMPLGLLVMFLGPFLAASVNRHPSAG